MIGRSRIGKIIQAGTYAPSGDNSQPWSFEVRDDSIRIVAHPEHDHEILNIENRGTYIAIGALIENMVIAAQYDGIATDIVLFPDGRAAASMRFREATDAGHRLYHAIEMRHTHRGPYASSKSGLPDFGRIAEGNCRTHLIEDPESIRTIAKNVSLMEETALQTKKLHRLFFNSIVWSRSENESGTPGLYIKTTELPPPVQALFHLICYWPVMKILNILGFPVLAAKSNAAVYARSAAYVALVLARKMPADYVAAGRCMQRLWLEAEHAGFAAQPLAGLLYLAEYIDRTNDSAVNAALRIRIRAARETIERIAGAEHGCVAMVMRIGKPLKGASARARRRPPHIL